MRSLLILTIAVGLAAACSQTEQHQPLFNPKPGVASTPAQRSDPQPPPAAAAPAASATTPQQGAAESAAAAPCPQRALPRRPHRRRPRRPSQLPSQPRLFAKSPSPAATSLGVKVLSTLASNTSKVEDPVRGALADAVVVSGGTAVPEGAEISGLVTDVKRVGTGERQSIDRVPIQPHRRYTTKRIQFRQHA